MKKLALCALLLSLSVVTIGCQKKAAAPSTAPAATEKMEGDAPAATPETPAAEPAATPEKPAEGDKPAETEKPAEGENK